MGSIVAQPRTTVNIQNASQSVGNAAHKVLLIGQKVAAGTAAAGALVSNIGNDNSEDTLFGVNSMLAGMIRAAKKENKVTIMDAIPLDDSGTGVAATGNITVTGTATAAGTLEVIVGSEKNHKFSIAVSNGDTATVVGAAIQAAVLADLDCPVTPNNVAGVVTMTADNDGTVGNSIGLSISGSIAGLTLAATAMTGGANDPTLTAVFDVIGENRYQTIIWPYAATSVLTTLLDARWNVTNRIQDGVGIVTVHDSLANHTTALGSLNSQSLVYICDKTESAAAYKASAQFELTYVKSAIFGAIRALRLTDDANLSQYVITTNGALDGKGGPALASKPYFNTALPNLPVVAASRGWTDTEIEQLHDIGGTVLGVNPAGSAAIAGEVVTTYLTDSAGNTDISFKYLNYVDTSSNAREYFFNNLRARFSQSRLTEGAIHPGRDMANALTIRSYCEKLYKDLSGVDYVLVQDGEAAFKFFKQNLSVVLDLATGTATINMVVPLVTQLRNTDATMKIAFSTEG